jgi:hypothetical protein
VLTGVKAGTGIAGQLTTLLMNQGDIQMKTAKTFVLIFVLALAGYVYADDAHKMHTDSKAAKAACCAKDASCQMKKSDCCVPGAECCKEGASCCTKNGSCCDGTKCATADHKCCSADGKGCSADMACCKTDSDGKGCCGEACHKAKAGKK